MRVHTQNVSCFLIIFTLLGCGSGDDAPEIPTGPSELNFNSYVISETFNGASYMVIGIEEHGYLAAFKSELSDGTAISLETTLENWPNIFSDETGSFYDFMGRGISGPNAGKQLLSMESQLGFWFSINATFPTAVYPETAVNRTLPLVQSAEWNIDPNTVVSGALRDAIPALNHPEFISANDEQIIENEDYMDPNDRVLIVANEQVTKIYPYKILDRHEIVNDMLGDEPIVVSYCPLTGTGTVWSARINNRDLEFGVSGLLSESNLILYDRSTESYWSQIRKEAVFGEFKDSQPVLFPHQETLWSSVQNLPNLENVEVLSLNTGFDYNYDFYPYGDYRTANNLIFFPTTYSDNRVPAKEIVLGVIVNGEAKVYRFSN
ncbi:MAG: DUF3179 domain-containing protein [Roseivirga sp.]|nr:DUF3179 domain-containing protein [Roseivirga sp.]